MARAKANNGVLATIQRLTGKPCSSTQRHTLNKYLYEKHLFEDTDQQSPRYTGKKMGKLRAPDTDNLVRNLLDLDALFDGETSTVIGVITKTIETNKLDTELDDIRHKMQQRVDIYSFWLERLSSARAVFSDPNVDLKVARLDEKLTVTRREDSKTLPAFALHALRVQEASEAKGRVSLPTAKEYVERAEAYLALNDLANADRNACSAIAQDSACARGWFIRVAIALQRRQSAMQTFRRKRIEAQEFADPLSAHERWALEQADDAASEASEHQQSLNKILPKAILHWPKTAGRLDHADLWKQVRNIFVNQMFQIAVHDVQRSGTWQQWAHLNGFEEEWEMERQKHPYAWSVGLTTNSPFTVEESQSITNLLTLYDSKPQYFFDTFEEDRIRIDFLLYHLRYVLRMDGCNAHWSRLNAAVAESPVDWKAKFLMRDRTIAKLWQLHYCRHLHAPSLVNSYVEWLQQTQAQSNGRSQHLILQQYAYLYHHQYVRRQFGMCSELTSHALAIFAGATTLTGWFTLEKHPYDDSVGMPIHQSLYWKYLAAVSAIEQRKQGGQLSAEAQAILANQNNLQKAFAEQYSCFWTASEEYEEGGGDEWPEPPYGIDLREPSTWLTIVESSPPH